MDSPKTIADVIKSAREANAPTASAAANPAPATAADAAPTGEAKGEKKPLAFKAVAVDDQGVIIGIGASIGVDSQDEAVTKAALLGLAYEFCAGTDREFRANHDEKAKVDAELVCSWPGAPVLKSGTILAPGQEVPPNDPIVAINIEKGAETHWFVGIRPKDEAVLKAARNGEIAGFSWGGYASKENA